MTEMDASLKIKKFKQIDNELNILALDKVNYFIGRNNSGKSSILNAVSYLNDGVNSKHFFNKESVVELSLQGKKQFIRWDENDPNRTSHNGNLNLKIIFPNEGISEKGANGVIKTDFSYNNISRQQFDFINTTLEYLGLPKLQAKKIINNDDPWDESVGKRVFLQNGKEINPHFLSNGFKSFNNIRHCISNSLEMTNNDEKARLDGIFIIVEEPENNLHPDLQKKVPHFLNEILTNQEGSIIPKIYFFIATHSPFIVSEASRFNNQKIYGSRLEQRVFFAHF